MPEYHIPVLLRETIALLEPKPGGVYVDATLGGGGHGAELLGILGPDGLLIGIDRDPEAIEHATKRLAKGPGRAKIVQGNFRDIGRILGELGISQIDGAIFDLGVSSRQLDAERGFSFMRDEPLSMKMDPSEPSPDAADIVNSYSEPDLAGIIRKYGEERYAGRVARAIVERRRISPIRTTGELTEVILSAVGARYRGQDIHPATRTYQGLRIEVNRELEAAEAGITAAVQLLKPGGRIAVISFHSLEDGIVKSIFRRLAGKCECPPRLPECRCGARQIVRILTRKPIVPSQQEIRENPRSRSAKLRGAERVGI